MISIHFISVTLSIQVDDDVDPAVLRIKLLEMDQVDDVSVLNDSIFHVRITPNDQLELITIIGEILEKIKFSRKDKSTGS